MRKLNYFFLFLFGETSVLSMFCYKPLLNIAI